jgi:hypothetical protein
MRNPYDWQRHHPKIEVPRLQVAPLVAQLRHGGSAVVLGGRGMGKSVFLHQVQTAVEQSPAVRACLLPTPPPELTVKACLRTLARALGLAASEPFDSRDLLETYLRQDSAPSQIVLLYDEFDHYASSTNSDHTDSPGRRFFNDLEAIRRDLPGVSVLAVGSMGVFVHRDVLGSSFLSRASWFWLTPFERSHLQILAQPFAGRGDPLSEDILDALYLATGGHPALVTYGLQRLWDVPFPTERSVADIFIDFQQQHREFLRDVQLSFADPKLSEAPQRVWELIASSGGSIPRSALQAACGRPSGPLRLDLLDVLQLLRASGLIAVTGSEVSDDPVAARPIASLLNLPTAAPAGLSFRERLLQDLQQLLNRLHAASADFFRTGGNGRARQLVPEAVFAAFLGMGFGLLGWRAEREAQHAAGRTDIKLRREGSDELAIIEVKIWGRNDYQEVHRQVESYWSANVTVGAVVMLTDAELPDWPEDYRRRCLDPFGVPIESGEAPAYPIRARFFCVSKTIDGMTTRVDHLLLRLARRG